MMKNLLFVIASAFLLDVHAKFDYILVNIDEPSSLGRFVSVSAAFSDDTVITSREPQQFAAVLVEVVPADGCGPLKPRRSGSSISGNVAVVHRGNCSFVNKTLNAQSFDARGVLVVNNASNAFVMGAGDDDGGRVRILASMVTSDDGATLLKNLPLSATLTGYNRSAVDGSLFAMFFIAVGTTVAAAWFASSRERAEALARANHQPPPRLPPEEEIAFVTVQAAVAFVFVASAGLLLLFFLMDYLIWVVIVIFCIGGTQGMIACFSAVAKSLLPKRYRRLAVVPCCGEVPVISLALVAPCMGIALWWVVERHADYSVCLLMLMQRTIRLPNIKVSCLLLVLAFLYDIFWVFLSGFFFKESVMISVATGGDTGEAIPMVIRLPRFHDTLGGYSLLGLGDIALPGLLVSFLLRFDYRKQLFGMRGYFIIVSVGYAVGVAITDLVLVLSKHGQPALLYLVPCTLGVVCLVAHRRGHLAEMWEAGDGSHAAHAAHAAAAAAGIGAAGDVESGRKARSSGDGVGDDDSGGDYQRVRGGSGGAGGSAAGGATDQDRQHLLMNVQDSSR